MDNTGGRGAIRIAVEITMLTILFLEVSAGAVPAEEWNKTFGGTREDYKPSVLQTSDGGYILVGIIYSYGAGFGDAWLVKTDANGKEQWNRTFGGKNDDVVYSFQQTKDGGCIIAGSTYSFGAGLSDAWIIKTDAKGNEVWNRTFGGKEDEYAFSVQQTPDEGYIIAGKTHSYGAGSDAWLIKTDPKGNEVWNRTFRTGKDPDVAGTIKVTADGGYIFAGSSFYYAWLIKTDTNGIKQWNKTLESSGATIQQTSDGGYVLAGLTSSRGAGGSDAWFSKIDANGNELWTKTLGGTKYDAVSSVQQTSDGGYILAGATGSYGNVRTDVEGVVYYDVPWDVWLIKTDANGNEQWNKTFGGTGFDEANSVQQTSDGGYILAGTTSSYGAGGWDFWLIKVGTKEAVITPTEAITPIIDKSPEKPISGFVPHSEQWQKTFGGTGKLDWAESVKQASDGGYIIAGRTKSYGTGNSDAWLIKTDANGIEQWNKTFGGTEDDGATFVQQTTDEGYILAGFTFSYGAGSNNAWLIKTDKNGNEQWNKIFGGNGYDAAFSVQQIKDGGYILGGATSSFGAGSDDAWLIKTDTNGNELWNKTFGGLDTDIAYSVQQTSDGEYILAGFTNSYGAGHGDTWLIKTDANGNLQWSKTFGGTVIERAYSVFQTSDGGYALAGVINIPISNAWLIKTDKNGNEQWNKTFGGNETGGASFVQQTKDDGYILAGGKQNNAWLIKTDKEGNEKWNETFGKQKDEKTFSVYGSVSSVQQTEDDGYILAGTTNFYGPGDDDAWLIKVSGERTEKAAGFEVVQAIAVLSALCVFGRKYLRLN
jgi:hypothetical protein